MKSFSSPLWPTFLCRYVSAPAAVAHVHGGLQWSECAGSRESQLLKDEPARQQRDSKRSLWTLWAISPDWTQRAAGLTLRTTTRALRNSRMYVGRNVAGQILASTGLLSAAHDSDIVFFNEPQILLKSCYLPSHFTKWVMLLFSSIWLQCITDRKCLS